MLSWLPELPYPTCKKKLKNTSVVSIRFDSGEADVYIGFSYLNRYIFDRLQLTAVTTPLKGKSEIFTPQNHLTTVPYINYYLKCFSFNWSFTDVMKDLYDYVNPKTGKHSPMISSQIFKIIQDNSAKINSAIVYDRDFNYNYFGFKVMLWT